MQAHRQQMPLRVSRRRGLWTVLAIFALLVAVWTLVVRARPLTNIVNLILAVGSPYVVLVAFSGLALAVLARRIRLAIVAALVVAVTVGVQVHWYYLASPSGIAQHANIRLLSSNLRKGQADATAFVELAKGNADVVTVSELTRDAVLHFSEAGMDDAFPYSVLIPGDGAGGVGLWSRYPLSSQQTLEHSNPVAVARLEVPGVQLDPMVASVHAWSPVAHDTNSFVLWRDDIAATKAQMTEFTASTSPGAVVVAGDFNSTPDMWQFRDLLTNGYRDAVDQLGSGFAPTFPSNTALPPFITIDHVLTRQAAASSIRAVDVPGSDHRGLLATIQVPLNPTTAQ